MYSVAESFRGSTLLFPVMERGSGTPHRFAHFELIEEIGRGGMGEVYRARDTRLGRQVAIKVLPAVFAGDPDRRSRFLREARAAAQLNHPNIATLYEVGEAEWTPPPRPEGATEVDGFEALAAEKPRPVIYLAMEYVAGEDLGPRLESKRLSLKETLDYGIQISEALAAAHASGVIHRDLKPQNVRITPDGRVKILDFGLAKMVQEGSVAEDTRLTAHGAIVGTAPYMAPEQLQGASEVDSRCDLFSFGVVLYQMLAGRLPFQALRLVDYVKALTHQTPEPVSHSNPEVSPQLEQVVGRLLEKNPQDRYGSAIEVGEALKAIARGTPIDPPPSRTRPGDSLFGEVFQPFRRPWVGWAVGAVFLVALLAVWRGGWMGGATASTEPVKIIHMPAFENVTGDPGKDQVCRGLGLALATSFQEVPVVVVQEAKDADNLDVPMRLEGSCVQLGDESSTVLLRLIDRKNGVMVWSRSIEASTGRVIPEMTWKVAEALGVALLPEVRERLNRTPARSVSALTHYFQGLERQTRFDDEDALKEAEGHFRQALQLEPDFALADVGLSEVLRRLGWRTSDGTKKDQAETLAREAIELDPSLPAARLALAKIFRDEGKLQEALHVLEELAASQPGNLEFQLQLAQMSFRVGRTNESIARFEDTLRSSGLDAKNFWRYWNQLGAMLLDVADYDGAREAFLKARELAGNQIAVPNENLISVELYRGSPDSAIATYEADPSLTVSFAVALNLGTAYFQRGDYQSALGLYDRAIEIRPENAVGYANRGDALKELGDRTAAKQAYQTAFLKAENELAVHPTDADLLMLHLLFKAKAGNCENIQSEVEGLTEELPDSVENKAQFAQSLALCNLGTEALALLREAVEDGASKRRLCQEPELRPLCNQLGS